MRDLTGRTTKGPKPSSRASKYPISTAMRYLLLAIILSGCTSTYTQSVRNPAAGPALTYQGTLVLSRDGDLIAKTTDEQAMVKCLKDYKIKVESPSSLPAASKVKKFEDAFEIAKNAKLETVTVVGGEASLSDTR